MKRWERITPDNIDAVSRYAEKLTCDFYPNCVKCNKGLDNDDYDGKKCSGCGYDSFTSCRICVKTHYKDLPQEMIDVIVSGFK